MPRLLDHHLAHFGGVLGVAGGEWIIASNDVPVNALAALPLAAMAPGLRLVALRAKSQQLKPRLFSDAAAARTLTRFDLQRKQP
jgi:hypothetical protein